MFCMHIECAMSGYIITCLQINSEKQIIIKKVDFVALIFIKLQLTEFRPSDFVNTIISTLLCNVRSYIIFLQKKNKK